MATKKNEEKPVFNIKGMRIANVRKVGEKVICFSLLGNGLGLYNLRVVSGSKGKFIGSPQSKGKDDAWYDQYAVYFSEEDQKKVIAAVEKKLEETADGDEL